jgi:hypothetical protein
VESKREKVHARRFRKSFRRRLPNLLMKNSLSLLAFFIFGLAIIFAQPAPKTAAQSVPYRIGERLTYNVSFNKMTDAAFAEIYVVSRGKLAGRDAVELQAKFKTMNLVSAFYLVDEMRTSYVSAETGLPLYTKIVSYEGVQPKETAKNFLENPSPYSDLLTAIYQARSGVGNISFQEGEKMYNAVVAPSGAAERVKTDAGEFETTVAAIQSSYFDEIGIKELRINFSSDEARLPVLIRFKTQKGEFRAGLASIQTIVPETNEPAPTPTPKPIPTPVQTPRPTPSPTPTPSADNQPLPEDLPFVLGETLSYKISAQNQTVGTVVLQAKERKFTGGRDSLLLTATMTEGGQTSGIFRVGDAIRSQVDPLSLAPYSLEIKLAGGLAGFNQVVQFDQTSGSVINTANANRIDVPVGTHGILSLAYAVRLFNLTPSKNVNNPVNDTRVALFFGDKYYVVSMRSLSNETVEFNGRKIPAQIVSVTTGDPMIDQYNLRIWLSNDAARLPLRLTAGIYRADLQSATRVVPK